MSYDVLIHLSGKPSDPETFVALAEAVEASGLKVNFDEPIEVDDVLPMFEKAAKEGRHVEVTGRPDDLLEEVRDACQAAGVGYLLWSGPTGQDEYDAGIFWRPGMTHEFTFAIGEQMVAIHTDDVREAAAGGIEVVNALVKTAEAAGRPGRVEFADGFAEACRTHRDSLNDEGGTPAP